MRPYAGETDLHRLVHLLNACEAVDQHEAYYSVDQLRLEMTEPGFDASRDLRLWENSDGQVIAMGQVYMPTPVNAEIDSYVWFRVHPNYRADGLDAEILAWAERRVVEVANGKPVRLSSSTRENYCNRSQVLTRCGFQLERNFLTMERSLLDPLPEPWFPDHFYCRPVVGKEEAAAWVEAFNQSFIDHWDYHPLSLDRHLHWLANPDYDPNLDLVAIAPGGDIAAFCYCVVPHEENQMLGKQLGWVGLLGTRRGFRRMGLARAMLLTGLHHLKNAGMTAARLGVDTDNPNRAQTLYESVGFRPHHKNLSYRKTL